MGVGRRNAGGYAGPWLTRSQIYATMSASRSRSLVATERWHALRGLCAEAALITHLRLRPRQGASPPISRLYPGTDPASAG